MIYALGKGKDKRNNKYLYRVLDIKTLTVDILSIEKLKKLLDIEGNFLVNASIESDIVTIKEHLTKDGSAHPLGTWCIIVGSIRDKMLTVKVRQTRFRYDLVSMEEVKQIIKEGKALNGYKELEGGKYVYKVRDQIRIYDEEYSDYIDAEYARYKKKIDLLGLKATLEYMIIGHDVILTNLFSRDKKILIPNFITHIAKNEVNNRCNEIIIGTGVIGIGKIAILIESDNKIIVPDNVKYVCGNSLDIRAKYGIGTGMFLDDSATYNKDVLIL